MGKTLSAKRSVPFFPSHFSQTHSAMAAPHILARAVIRDDGQVLVVWADSQSHTFLPGGHREEGEGLEQCLRRELAKSSASGLGSTLRRRGAPVGAGRGAAIRDQPLLFSRRAGPHGRDDPSGPRNVSFLHLGPGRSARRGRVGAGPAANLTCDRFRHRDAVVELHDRQGRPNPEEVSLSEGDSAP